MFDQGFIKGERMEIIAKDTQLCENCGAVVNDPDLDEITDHLLSCLHLLCCHCLPNSHGDNTEEPLCPVCSGSNTSDSFLQDEKLTDQIPGLYQNAIDIDILYRPSSKISALLRNLQADRLKATKNPIKRHATFFQL